VKSKSLPVVIFCAALSAAVVLCAQDQSTPTPKKSQTSAKASSKTSKSKASSKKSSARSKKKTLTPAQRAALQQRARRAHRAFVASSELRPMAQQLLEARTPPAYAGVEAYARKHAKQDAGALAYFVLGYAHFLDHDFAKAIPDLKRAQLNAGEIGDYTDYFLATCYSSTNAPDPAHHILSDFATRHPDSVLLRDAAVLDANILMTLGNPKQVITVLEPYRNGYHADIELLLGRAYLRSGDSARGGEILRRIYYTAPASPQADAAAIDLQSLTGLPAPSFADRAKRASLLLDAKRNQDAVKEFRALLAAAPAESQPELELKLGIALYQSGNRKDAREALESIPDSSGETAARRDQYLVELARSDGDEDRLNRILDRMRGNEPASPALQDALLSAGNMFLLKKDYEKSERYYRELAQRFPTGKSGPYAHWKATWLAMRMGKKDEARQLLDEHLRVFPASSEVIPALYWRGRLAEDDKDVARARGYYRKLSERFRFYYYADLARERLKEIKLEEAVEDPALAKIPDSAAMPGFSADPPQDNVHYQHSLLLRNGALFEYAVRELQAAQAEGDAPWVPEEIARVYEEGGLYHRALQSLKRAVPGYFTAEIAALPRPYWETLFPRPWWEDMKRYSAENQLDPFLVASLVRQESEFNPAAISRANAFGLMQILPSTGRTLARSEKLRSFSTEQLLVPSTNVRLGTKYFKELLDHFDGHVEYALAAYNAGQDRVEDWLNNGHFRDVPEFVESIPFTETRDYVQAIMRNASVYRRLYGQP
jgi:soluble lytic murein transglycosylase